MTKRRVFWIAFACLALLAVGGIGFVTFFEEVPVKKRSPPAPEARRNPYLALERFLQRMGRPLQRQNDARLLDTLPPGGVLILDDQRRAHMTPARLAHLLAWVEQGGALIVTPEPGQREDPLLKAFQLTRWQPQNRPKPADDEDDDAAPAVAAPPSVWCTPPAQLPGGKPAPWPQRFTLQAPGMARTLTADFAGNGLCPGERAPEWLAGAPGFGAQIVHFRHGNGQVTFVNSLRRWFSNWRIAEHDHAELLWYLVDRPQAQGPVILLTRLSLPSLREWLVENMAAALLAAATLLLLWLWRILPRFGPPRPGAVPERRALREHLAAVGSYVWRTGGLSHWLQVARESFLQRLALRHPALAALPPGEQAAALSRLTNRPPATIANALHAPAETPTAFTQALRTLKNLERSL